MGAGILGIGMAVPERKLGNDELCASLDTDDAWIRQRTGIVERRIAAPDEATSTFASKAARGALADAGVRATDVDLVVVATCTPDYPIPGTAPLVQTAIGATNAGAFDVNAGCTGFVTALSVASGMVAAGHARTVLVCGADTLSRVTDYDDRTTAVLFGDGAGAVVVGASGNGSQLGPFVQGADGSKADWLLVPAGGSRRPADKDTVVERAHAIRMRGQDVYRHAVDRMTESALRVLDGAPASSVDLVVAHQANARIVRAVADRLGLDRSKVVCNIAGYGNTSAGSIPIALAEAVAEGRLHAGMRVLLAAFGAGFSWAAGMVQWGARGAERDLPSGAPRR
jgi:3-oxoacyl-[acyl-carrier-protein] synthase-3